MSREKKKGREGDEQVVVDKICLYRLSASCGFVKESFSAWRSSSDVVVVILSSSLSSSSVVVDNEREGKLQEDTRRHRGNELIRCDASPHL